MNVFVKLLGSVNIFLFNVITIMYNLDLCFTNYYVKNQLIELPNFIVLGVVLNYLVMLCGLIHYLMSMVELLINNDMIYAYNYLYGILTSFMF